MTSRSTQHPDDPLRGIRVLVTRPRLDAGTLRSGLEQLGAEVLHLPTSSIRPLTDSDDVAADLSRLADFDWVAFTSRNAVRAVLDWLNARQLRIPATLRVAAVGDATAQELRDRGIRPNHVPPESSARALAAELLATDIRGRSVLLPQGNLAGDELRRALQDAGALVTTVCVYETVPAKSADAEVKDMVARGDIDVVTLASPSAFRNLLELTGASGAEVLRRTRLVAIGPTTAEAIRSAGYTASAVAATQTMEGIVDAIVNLYQGEQS